MKIIGHFTANEDLPEEYKNENVFFTSKQGEFRTPISDKVFSFEDLRQLEIQHYFAFDTIDIEAPTEVKKVDTKTKEYANFKDRFRKNEKTRITTYSIILVILIIINIIAIVTR